MFLHESNVVIDNGIIIPYHNKTVISLNSPYWVSADGKRHEFEDMATSHLSNTILMLIRMCQEDRLHDLFSSVTFQGLITEYRRRSDKIMWAPFCDIFSPRAQEKRKEREGNLSMEKIYVKTFLELEDDNKISKVDIMYAGTDKERAFSGSLNLNEKLVVHVWIDDECLEVYQRTAHRDWLLIFGGVQVLEDAIRQKQQEINRLEKQLDLLKWGDEDNEKDF